MKKQRKVGITPKRSKIFTLELSSDGEEGDYMTKGHEEEKMGDTFLKLNRKGKKKEEETR